MKRAFLVLVLAVAALIGVGYAATLETVTITVVDDYGRPLRGASVTFAAGSATFTATSDNAGKATLSVPPDRYTVVTSVHGFSLKTTTIVVTTDSTQTSTIQLRRTGETRAQPPPTTVGAKPGNAQEVRDAVVAGYNKTHPEHKAGMAYFGRYTYVLLRDNSARSKTLVAALVEKFQSDGTIAVGPPVDIDNPWGYNLFLLPLKNANLPAGTLSALKIVLYYDFTASKNLRDRYCATAKHAKYSLCKAPYDGGPILLTFLRPVSELKKNDPLPPALAYDFSGVPEEQFAVTIGKLQQTVAVTEPIENDTLLPPPVLSKYVAPLLSEITAALTNLIPKLKIFHDNGVLP